MPMSAPPTDSVESPAVRRAGRRGASIPSPPTSSSSRATLEQFGRKSLQTAEAYVDLADAQRQAKLHERAAENYLAAVEVYRAIDGPFTPLAIAPLTSLGDNYHEADDDVNAVAAYSEARTVSRRAYGLHNEAQIELLDRMSRSLLDLNQLTEAEEQQVEALRLVQRSNPPDSDAVLEAIYRYAEWLGERLQFQLERDQYMRALRIIRATHGERDVRQVQSAARHRQYVSRGAQSRGHGHLGAPGGASRCCSSSPNRTPRRSPAPCAISAIGPSRSARRATTAWSTSARGKCLPPHRMASNCGANGSRAPITCSTSRSARAA